MNKPNKEPKTNQADQEMLLVGEKEGVAADEPLILEPADEQEVVAGSLDSLTDTSVQVPSIKNKKATKYNPT